MAEPIEMPFALKTWVGPGKHVLDGSPDLPWEGTILKEASYCKVQGHYAVICAKTAEPIMMPFELWAWTGPQNRELDELDGCPDAPMKRGNFVGKGRPL